MLAGSVNFSVTLSFRFSLFSSTRAAKQWIFHTCGAVGPEGPTPSQCLNSYRNSNVNVTVGTQGPFKGIQMWRVQESGTYRYGRKLLDTERFRFASSKYIQIYNKQPETLEYAGQAV